jgi:hypothetical protein
MADAFKVLTEFRFDVGNAVLNSETLRGSVDKLANSADQAQVAFQSLSAGLLGQFSLSQFSLIELLKKSIGAATEFGDVQQSFAQMLSANMNYLSGSVKTYNDRLQASKTIMNDIIGMSAHLGVPATALIKGTTVLGGTLAKEGLAGNNMMNATAIAAKVLKISPSIGIAPSAGAGQAAGILSGKSVAGNALFDALVGSTKSFKEFKDSADSFIALPMKQRLDLLNQGLKELGDQAGPLGEDAMTLSGLMDHLKDMFFGLAGFLKPIGDAILPALIKIVKEFSDRVGLVGKALGQSIGRLLTDALADPKKLLANLSAASKINKDFDMAKKVVGIGFVIEGLVAVLTKLGLINGGLMRIVKVGLGFLMDGLMMVFRGIGTAIMSMGFAGLMFVLNMLAGIIGEVIFPMMVLISIFQGVRRAWEAARIEQAARLLELLPKIADMTERFWAALQNLLLPFEQIADGVEMLLKPLFSWILSIDILLGIVDVAVKIFEFLGTTMVLFEATISGVVMGIIGLIDDLKHLRFHDIGKDWKTNFNMGVDDFINKNLKTVNKGGGVANQVTNNHFGNVEIKNDFKDNVEPDRIAFTMKDQLLKAAQNPTQSRGRSFQAGFATR